MTKASFTEMHQISSLDQVGDLEGVRAQGAACGLGLDEFGQGAFRQALPNLDSHCGVPSVLL